jgi:hypothetical protein
MKPLRWLAAGLVWILSGVVGLVGALLCVTILLLPLGIPVLMLARRLFSFGAVLALPRAARHPAQEAGKMLRRGADDAKSVVDDAKKGAAKKSRRARKKVARA